MEKLEAGIDEVGRGSLSGPVFAAAVTLPEGFKKTILQEKERGI